MICYAFLGIIFTAELLVGIQSASVISLSDDVDPSYVLDSRLDNNQDLGTVMIFLNTYINPQTKACLKIATIQVNKFNDGEEYYMDAFQVSCDINPPFTMTGNMIDMAGIVNIFVEPGKSIWAVFKFGNAGGCVQRLYTDNNWAPLDMIQQMELSGPQCQSTITSQRPMQSGIILQTPEPVLPEFGKTQGQIITLGDAYIENFDCDENKEDKEENGASTRMVVSRLAHRENKQCTDLVYIDMKESEDVLDSVQVTCDDTATFVKAKDMLVYGGMIYLRDHPGDAVWAVYLMKNKCELREYTDQNRQLIQPQNRMLSWAQCKRIVESQQISWLPKLPRKFVFNQQKPAPVTPDFASVQHLIAQHSATVPSSLPPPTVTSPGSQPVSLSPQPLGSQPSPPTLLPQPLNDKPAPPAIINININQPPTAPAQQPLSAASTDPKPLPATVTSSPPVTTTPPAPAKSSGLFGGWFNKLLGKSDPPSPPPVPASPAVSTVAVPSASPVPPVAPASPQPANPVVTPAPPAATPAPPAKKKWWFW